MRTSLSFNSNKQSSSELIKAHRCSLRPKLAFRSTKMKHAHRRSPSVAAVISHKEFLSKPRSMSLCSATSDSSDDVFRFDFCSKLLIPSSSSDQKISSDTNRTPMLFMRPSKVVLDDETSSVVSLGDERPSTPTNPATCYDELCWTPKSTFRMMLSPPVFRVTPSRTVFLHVDPAIASKLYLPDAF